MNSDIVIIIVSLSSIIAILYLLACAKKGWAMALQVFHLFPIFAGLFVALFGVIKLATMLFYKGGLPPLVGGIIGLAMGVVWCYAYIHIGAYNKNCNKHPNESLHPQTQKN